MDCARHPLVTIHPVEGESETMRVQAIWKDTVLAESEETVVVEGNHYFPPEAINWEFFEENTRHTTCPWKGLASYYDVSVDGDVNKSAAWFYPEPSTAAAHIRNHVAFWNGVKVGKVNADGEVESKGILNRVIGSIFGS